MVVFFTELKCAHVFLFDNQLLLLFFQIRRYIIEICSVITRMLRYDINRKKNNKIGIYNSRSLLVKGYQKENKKIVDNL